MYRGTQKNSNILRSTDGIFVSKFKYILTALNKMKLAYIFAMVNNTITTEYGINSIDVLSTG